MPATTGLRLLRLEAAFPDRDDPLLSVWTELPALQYLPEQPLAPGLAPGVIIAGEVEFTTEGLISIYSDIVAPDLHITERQLHNDLVTVLRGLSKLHTTDRHPAWWVEPIYTVFDVDVIRLGMRDVSFGISLPMNDEIGRMGCFVEIETSLREWEVPIFAAWTAEEDSEWTCCDDDDDDDDDDDEENDG